MKNCLIISDTHFPYEHPDMFDFLEALAWAYDIEVFKHTGDMVDNHNGSYHEVEYGVLSPKEEHVLSREKVQRLYGMFPDMNVIIGNHGAMSYRKAKTSGIPEDHLKSYNDMYGVNWNWMDKDYFKVDRYNHCLLVHSVGANTLLNASRHSHHTIQGHHHSKFGVEYFRDTEVLRWSMTVGCLVDPHSPAFNYASKMTLNRQIIGCGGIIDNEPRLFRMQLKSNGRWDGKV